MTSTETEARLRAALHELADTTSVSSNAWERVTAQPVPRRRTPVRAMAMAATVALIMTGLVVVAVALRDETGNRVATQPASSTSSPPSGTTWITEGDLDAGHWKLTTRRAADGQIEVLFESGTTGGSLGPLTPGLLFTVGVRGGDDPVTFVFGVTPPSANFVHLTLPNGTSESIDVFGDEVGIGGHLFVTSVPANTVGKVDLEALDAAGNVVGVGQLGFRDGVVSIPDGCPADAPTPPPAGDDAQQAVTQAALTYARTTRGWADAEVYGLYRVGSGKGYDPVYAYNIPLFCGQAVADASYGVDFNSPSRAESASTSHGSVVVAHFADGWRVWGSYR